MLTSVILSSTAVREVLVILGFSVLTSFISVLKMVLVAKFPIPGILSSILLILALNLVFLTSSFFTTLLSLLKSTGVVSSFPMSNLSTVLHPEEI